MTDRPGLRWLARRAGCTPDDLLADPARLVAALASAGGAAFDLSLRLRSTDPAVQAQAEVELDRLRELVEGAPDPAERFRARVLETLRAATARVRDEPPSPPARHGGESGREDQGASDRGASGQSDLRPGEGPDQP